MPDRCPRCGADAVRSLGVVEPDISISGDEAYVEHCDDCAAEWERPKGSSRIIPCWE